MDKRSCQAFDTTSLSFYARQPRETLVRVRTDFLGDKVWTFGGG